MLGYGYGPLPESYDNGLNLRVFRNAFINARGDGEIISLKSDNNQIFDNCFLDNGHGGLVIRMGNNNSVSNNYFSGLETAAIRISGKANSIENNQFNGNKSGIAAIDLHNGGSASTDEYGHLQYIAATENLISNNTFNNYDYFVRDHPVIGTFFEWSGNNTITGNTVHGIATPQYIVNSQRDAVTFTESNQISNNDFKANSFTAVSDKCNY